MSSSMGTYEVRHTPEGVEFGPGWATWSDGYNPCPRCGSEVMAIRVLESGDDSPVTSFLELETQVRGYQLYPCMCQLDWMYSALFTPGEPVRWARE